MVKLVREKRLLFNQILHFRRDGFPSCSTVGSMHFYLTVGWARFPLRSDIPSFLWVFESLLELCLIRPRKVSGKTRSQLCLCSLLRNAGRYTKDYIYWSRSYLVPTRQQWAEPTKPPGQHCAGSSIGCPAARRASEPAWAGKARGWQTEPRACWSPRRSPGSSALVSLCCLSRWRARIFLVFLESNGQLQYPG